MKPISNTPTTLKLAQQYRWFAMARMLLSSAPESLGRLNIAAASAALADMAHVRQIRSAVAAERTKWITVLDELALTHTQSQASFIFFNAGRPQTQLEGALRAQGVDIGRTFPPYADWARITIGLPEENTLARAALRKVLA